MGCAVALVGHILPVDLRLAMRRIAHAGVPLKRWWWRRGRVVDGALRARGQRRGDGRPTPLLDWRWPGRRRHPPVVVVLLLLLVRRRWWLLVLLLLGEAAGVG